MRSIQKHPTISDNYLALVRDINERVTHAQRPPHCVRLLAVTKTRSSEEIRAAYEAGVRHVGENYLQEALPKLEALSDLNDLTWHFIGAIQSNKTALIAEHFDWVHTIDRNKIAQRLNRQRPAGRTPLNICINVNLHHEASKAGADPTALPELIGVVRQCSQLRARGLMAIPAINVPPAESFNALSQLHRNLAQPPDCWDTLSMGMSGDYAEAITAGSTMIRIGTALFGPRPTRQK